MTSRHVELQMLRSGLDTLSEEYLERILKAAGSSLRHYTPQSKAELRAAMREVIADVKRKPLVPYAGKEAS